MFYLLHLRCTYEGLIRHNTNKSTSLSRHIGIPQNTQLGTQLTHFCPLGERRHKTATLVMIFNRHIRGPNIQSYGQTQTVTKFRYLLGLTDLSWQLSGILCGYWRATDKDTYKAVSDTARRKKLATLNTLMYLLHHRNPGEKSRETDSNNGF